MSHQSGIRASPELLSTFSAASNDQDHRAFKVIIEDEVLLVAESLKTGGSWEEDFPRISEWMKPTEPCIILYRHDSTSTVGSYDWILLQYVPDAAKVREKMLLASSKATLLKDLGDSKFVNTLYGTIPADLSLDGYRKHLAHKEADAPLTEREQEAQIMKANESTADIGSTSRQTHAARVGCPFTREATAALEKLKAGHVNAVALNIDVQSEVVGLIGSGEQGLSDLPTLVESGVPRFVFFNHERSLVFVYVCPPSSKIRERMMYSSFRNSLVISIEKEMGMAIAKKLEVDSVDELDGAELAQETSANGTPELTKKTFARPVRPGRGPARVSRPATPNSPIL